MGFVFLIGRASLDPNEGGNRERTETEWLVLVLTLTLTPT